MLFYYYFDILPAWSLWHPGVVASPCYRLVSQCRYGTYYIYLSKIDGILKMVYWCISLVFTILHTASSLMIVETPRHVPRPLITIINDIG